MNKIAEKRIKGLIELAGKSRDKGKRYVGLARKISTRTRTRISKQDKLKFCKSCNTPYSADSFRVRINSKKNEVVYTCLKCGAVHRYPFKQ